MGPRRAFQSRPGSAASHSLRTAQSLQGFREPRTRDDLPPVAFARSKVVVRIHIGPSDHAQRVTKPETSFGGDALGLAEIFHHSAQPLPLTFHPPPSNQPEPLRPSPPPAALCMARRLAIARDVR